MDITKLRDKCSALKIEKQSFLNDTYLWVEIAREAINKLPDTKFEFQVPKAKKPEQLRTISRNHAAEVKKRMVEKDIFNSAFVSMVASVEDYLSKIMEWILLFDNNRVKCTIQGVNMVNSISVIDLVDNDKDEIIGRLIRQRLDSLFYASPQKQLEYLDKALGIKIEEDVWGKWVEIKARRDLWVHNAGIVNKIYIDKTKQYAKCNLDNEALIDLLYFKETVSILKRMMGCINREIRKVYNA